MMTFYMRNKIYMVSKRKNTIKNQNLNESFGGFQSMLLCENVVFDISWAKDIYITYQHSKVSIRYPCIEKIIFL